ncbi:corrinoid protein [Sporomusa acidovorans]|uniref:Methionine synthase n=1 Tax=Sporomusa acidovorans (strain ATCC 49682 / DSM 3132 / Mol) TaxID=1123286 RepID=A0ABZ3J871_SPOA4|nr:corrinoid protein [Sporomusa acidovorans]OZC21243.1 methionine synthase [Sporomusa acidovorans DSM 3132]SDE65737.1 5-methyltetrahydrofolate--homocysteine methyltransferase [Sporomusa acidovorans]
MATLNDLAQSVITGNLDQVKDQVKFFIANGTDPLAIINEGLIGGMNVVGARFKAGDMYVPEVLMSARTMNAGLEIVKPLIAERDIHKQGKVVLGTVKADLHDIGKNLVSMMMQSGGLEVIDIGIDAAPEKFVAAVKEHNPDIVGMSALLTTTMPAMQDTIELLTEEGLRDKVKIIVGGAPVSQEFANSIGADAYAPDAATATDLCKEFISA